MNILFVLVLRIATKQNQIMMSSAHRRNVVSLFFTCCCLLLISYSNGYTIMTTDTKSVVTTITSSSSTHIMKDKLDQEKIVLHSKEISRRDAILQQFRYIMTPIIVGTTTIGTTIYQPDIVLASTVTTGGNLGDLPPEAVRAYLQYRIQLQTSADFYIFELQDKIRDTSSWGEIGDLFVGNPNRFEREFTNIFRIVGLSMAPDEADILRDAQYNFERSIRILSKATGGIRRDLPVEIDKDAVSNAITSWDNGRVALNDFFITLNTITGLNEMKTIPSVGPNQVKDYGRSPLMYRELKKKIKLCQNRGGPTLSAAWGNLMISGLMQDSCGIPDLEEYFYQS